MPPTQTCDIDGCNSEATLQFIRPQTDSDNGFRCTECGKVELQIRESHDLVIE